MAKIDALGQKIAPILVEIEQTLWEREAALPDVPHDFPEEALRAACKIYAACIMDFMWKKQGINNISHEDRLREVKYFGESLRALTKQMTRLDTVDFYMSPPL